MNRKKMGITFLISTIATIAILAATVGKPNYAKHFNRHCQQTEVKTP